MSLLSHFAGSPGAGGLGSHASFASDPLRSLLVSVVAFELCGAVYTLTDMQAIVLAERLRNYARGAYPEEVKWASELSGNDSWTIGALAAADFIEEALVGNIAEPLPLGGKSAEAVFWTLRLLPGLGDTAESADAVALRNALLATVAAPPAAA